VRLAELSENPAVRLKRLPKLFKINFQKHLEVKNKKTYLCTRFAAVKIATKCKKKEFFEKFTYQQVVQETLSFGIVGRKESKLIPSIVN
jgi:hypothetical protein